MKKLKFLTIIVIFLAGCELIKQNDEHFVLSPKFITDLEKGDTLIFRSNLNNLSKYIVHEVEYGNIWICHNIQNNNFLPPFTYYESHLILIDTIRSETETKFHYTENFSVPEMGEHQLFYSPDFFSIGVSAFGGCDICAFCNWYEKNKDYRNGKALSESSSTILGQQFSNVFNLETDSTLFHFQKRHVERFYCNVRQGLLGFEYTDGEIYVLVN